MQCTNRPPHSLGSRAVVRWNSERGVVSTWAFGSEQNAALMFSEAEPLLRLRDWIVSYWRSRMLQVFP